MKNNFRIGFFVIAVLIILFTSYSALAYEVSTPLTIKTKFQYSNGVNVTDVVSQSCNISVFFQGSPNSFTSIVNASMVPGLYHSFTFTPTSVGDYVLMIQCGYGVEHATYNEVVKITPQIVGSSPNPANNILNLNARIVPEKFSYVVNQGVDSHLSFPIEYYLNGVLSNSSQATFTILKGDKMLNTGNLLTKGTGDYIFDYNFKDYVTGDYKIMVFFDGRSEFVDLSVISVSSDLNLITGFVTNSNGKVSTVKVGFLVVFFLILLLIIIAVIRSFMPKRGNSNR